MPNPFNGSRNGKRGGSTFRPSRLKEQKPSMLAVAGMAPRHENPTSGGADCNTGRWVDGVGILCEVSHIEEDARDWQGLERKSLTTKQHLRLKPAKIEVQEILEPAYRVRIVTDKRTGKKTEVKEPILMCPRCRSANTKLIPHGNKYINHCRDCGKDFAKGKPVTRKIVAWKSDTTLLRKGDPTDPLERIDFKRKSAYSKLTQTQREMPAVEEYAESEIMESLDGDQFLGNWPDLEKA